MLTRSKSSGSSLYKRVVSNNEGTIQTDGPRCCGATLLQSFLGSGSVGAHHLVVLVIEDVTVPHIPRPF
ncbi:MAG TPA: hypothetical protein VFB60_14370, partial [Ktedonobacteraceae bacterium]|nr:hypothetical protein [Ktedonobacteraceae bacterium]